MDYPFKRAKYAEYCLTEQDFVSFWQHYDLVQQWVRIQQESRQMATTDWEAEKQNVSMTASPNDANDIELFSVQTTTHEIPDPAVFNGLPTELETEIQLPSINSSHLECNTKGERNKRKKEIRNSIQKEFTTEYTLENDESLSEEMKAFMRTTLEHRKQRDEKRRLEQQRKKEEPIQSDADEFFDASKMSFKAANRKKNRTDAENVELAKQARAFRCKNLYGEEAAAKLESLEASVQARFDDEMSKHKPITWPNIPFRF